MLKLVEWSQVSPMSLKVLNLFLCSANYLGRFLIVAKRTSPNVSSSEVYGDLLYPLLRM
ncbi:unnamed protein product, partial [Brassica oleracea var. botrytis]